jgi:Ni,Fe-hydrogenase III component G
MDAQRVCDALIEHFSLLRDRVIVKSASRLTVDCPQESFKEVFPFITDELKFNALSAITGSDEAEHFSVIYHLNTNGRIILNLKLKLSRQSPSLQTVTARFPCADAFERELVDLLGIPVEGLAPGNRYPLPDTWPADDHPLRKDWKPKEAPHA